jgi:hypothetical protein
MNSTSSGFTPGAEVQQHAPINYMGVGNNPLLEAYRLRESFVVRKVSQSQSISPKVVCILTSSSI